MRPDAESLQPPHSFACARGFAAPALATALALAAIVVIVAAPLVATAASRSPSDPTASPSHETGPAVAPPWDELVPRSTRLRLTLVGEMAGHFWTFDDVRYHVWDLAFVRHPDGDVAILRAILQDADGELTIIDTQLADHPPGSVEIHALDEVVPGSAALLWWSDASGDVRTVNFDQLQPAAVGGGGIIWFDPIHLCGLSFQGRCLQGSCNVPCYGLPACSCPGRGTCHVNVSARCEGRCASFNSCRWEPILGGCTCQ